MSPPSPRLTELRALWRLALPLALAQAGQATMGMVDTAVLGRLSATAQGAAGLGNSVVFTFGYFGIGVMLALDALVSQAEGAGNPRRSRALYWQGVWLALLTSLLVMAAVALAPLTLEPFGVTPAIAQGASEYLWWRLPGVPALLLFVCARSYLQAAGRPAAIVWTMLVANGVNALLDVVLVFGAGPIPALGVTGAAVATVLCTWLQFALLAGALGKPVEGVARAPRWPDLRQAWRVGLPIGLHLIAESGIFTLAGVLAGRMGDVDVAAHHIALSWASVSFCVAVGIGSAGSVRVGRGVGQGDRVAARRSGLLAFGSGAAFMAASALAFLIAPEALARVMSDKPEVVATAASLFAVVALFQVSDGVQAVGAGVLRGAADTRFTFWANILGHWAIGFPVAWFFGVRGDAGVVGLWWGLSAGLTAVAVALLLRFWWLSLKPMAALDDGTETA